MPLSAGTRLGPYEILSPLGAGGMGEVYKARDTRLDRTVAIKVMPLHIAQREDLRQRFEREARVISSLNHPYICVLHDIGKQDGVDFMVLEHLEGETLEARVIRGPLPLDQVFKYGAQIADALDRAHRSGVSHRDVKPSNIMLTRDGVKVLDFGLAKSMPKTALSDQTLTLAMTGEGTVLGTPQYMAPELFEGKEADARSDIFGFGCVLYQMVTGKRAFDGKTRVSVVASIIGTEPPPMSSLQPVTPRALERLVQGCLAKDPEERYQSMWDVLIDLRGISEGRVDEPAKTVGKLGWLPWAVAGLFLIAAAVGFVHFREAPEAAPLIRTFIPAPDKAQFDSYGGLAATAPVALSPDGQRMTYGVRTADGKSQLWLRSLDALTAQPLGGTEDATHPFWSPDSRFIGFFAGGKLRKIDASGGPPITLCDAPAGRGGTWNSDGVIIFTPNGGGISRVAAAGGIPTPVEETGRWPWFLPDGRHFLFSQPPTIRLGSLDSKETKLLIETNSDAVYSQGHMIYLRDDTLMAQPFDLKTLATSGDAVPIAENVRSVGNSRRGVVSVSRNGLLAYQSGTGAGRLALTWFDRTGKRSGTLGEPGDFQVVDFSPDRKNLAVTIFDPANRTFDTWLYDVARGIRTRFTFDASPTPISAIWSPDGSSVVFATRRAGKWGLYRKASNMAGTEEFLYADDTVKVLTGWSPDGGFLLYDSTGANSPNAIRGTWILPLNGERKPFRFAENSVSAATPQFSPDGHWIAYRSVDSRRPEIYIEPFPGPGGKVQVSTTGGVSPRWRHDGKELFYTSTGGQMMAAELSIKGAGIEVGRVQALFDGLPTSYGGFDVSLDGQRFLVAVPPEQTAPGPLTLVQNWTAALKK